MTKPIVRILRGAMVYSQNSYPPKIHITVDDAQYAADEIVRLRKAIRKITTTTTGNTWDLVKIARKALL